MIGSLGSSQAQLAGRVMRPSSNGEAIGREDAILQD